MKCLRKLFPAKRQDTTREIGHFEKLCGPFARAIDVNCAQVGIKSFPHNVRAKDVFNQEGARWGHGIKFYAVNDNDEEIASVTFLNPLSIDPDTRKRKLREAAISIGATI